MNRFLQVLCVEHLNLSIVDPFVKAKLRGSPRTKVKFTCFLYPLQKSLILALFVLLGMVGVALSFPRPDDPYHKPVYHTPSHKGRVKMQVRKNKRKHFGVDFRKERLRERQISVPHSNKNHINPIHSFSTYFYKQIFA